MKYILLHGLRQTPISWEKVFGHFVHRTDLLCPNLFSFTERADTDYSTLYRAFSEYRNAFDEPLNLCGLSLGGVLALHYCIDHPEKVHSLVLIGTRYTMPKVLLNIQNLIFRLMPANIFGRLGLHKRDVIHFSQSMKDSNFENSLSKVHQPVLVVCGKKDRLNIKSAHRQTAQ